MSVLILGNRFQSTYHSGTGTPGTWRYLYVEEKESLPQDDEGIARKLYDFVVKNKLKRVKELGVDLAELYRRIMGKKIL